MQENIDKRIAVFAHYDKDNVIDDYVVCYLNALKLVAERIIFVSDSDLKESEAEKIKHIVSDCVVGRHGEYDFGSYKRGLEVFYDKYSFDIDEVVLCNDSCYGGLYPFNETFEKMKTSSADFWGMSCACLDKPNITHLQSFFMVFKEHVFSKEYFRDFFSSVQKQESKVDVVSQYEIGLSQMLIKQGHSFDVAFDIDDVKGYFEENRDKWKNDFKLASKNFLAFLNLNKKEDYLFMSDWIIALLLKRCPLLKVKYKAVTGICPVFVLDLIKKNSEYEIALINSHQKRICPYNKSVLKRFSQIILKPILYIIKKFICLFISKKEGRICVREFFDKVLE